MPKKFKTLLVLVLCQILYISGQVVSIPLAYGQNDAVGKRTSPFDTTPQTIAQQPYVLGQHSQRKNIQETIFQNLVKFQHADLEDDYKKKPFLYWQIWARNPIPLVPAFLFIWFFNFILIQFFATQIRQARIYCSKHFWKSALRGLAFEIFCLASARFLFISEIGEPLAYLVLGFSQLILLLGLTVSSSLFGLAVAAKSGLSKNFQNNQGSSLGLLLETTLGTIFVSLLLLIPGISILPPIGNRLVLLCSFLGAGALLRSSFLKEPDS